MSMSVIEQKRFSDVVALVNLTDHPLEFQWDSQVHVIEAGEKRYLPRHIAMKGIETHVVAVDAFTGSASASLFGIEGSKLFPCEAVETEVVETEAVETESAQEVSPQVGA